jgi:peptidoglycan L-alanyl-D-glutamate endopeptidase CwlK
MYSFGKKSSEKLATCRKELQDIANEAIKLVNFSVIHGYRTEEEQNAIYEQGFSKAKYPTSKHNTNPSDAFDFVPFPIDWKDTRQFAYIAGIILGIGLAKGIILRWGGDWNQNGQIKDERFLDFGHIEFKGMLEK